MTETCRRCGLDYLDGRVCSASNFTLPCAASEAYYAGNRDISEDDTVVLPRDAVQVERPGLGECAMCGDNVARGPHGVSVFSKVTGKLRCGACGYEGTVKLG